MSLGFNSSVDINTGSQQPLCTNMTTDTVGECTVTFGTVKSTWTSRHSTQSHSCCTKTISLSPQLAQTRSQRSFPPLFYPHLPPVPSTPFPSEVGTAGVPGVLPENVWKAVCHLVQSGGMLDKFNHLSFATVANKTFRYSIIWMIFYTITHWLWPFV